MGGNSMLSGAMYLSAVWFLVVQELRRPKSRATPDRGGDSSSRSASEQSDPMQPAVSRSPTVQSCA